MRSLKSRIARLKGHSRRDKPLVVIVQDDETSGQALARVNPRPGQLVVIIDR